MGKMSASKTGLSLCAMDVMERGRQQIAESTTPEMTACLLQEREIFFKLSPNYSS
jgi:hypothetical protein